MNKLKPQLISFTRGERGGVIKVPWVSVAPPPPSKFHGFPLLHALQGSMVPPAPRPTGYNLLLESPGFHGFLCTPPLSRSRFHGSPCTQAYRLQPPIRIFRIPWFPLHPTPLPFKVPLKRELPAIDSLDIESKVRTRVGFICHSS